MKIRKLLVIILIIFCIISLLNIKVYASTINTGNVNIDRGMSGQFDRFGSTIISTVRILGMIISVGALMIMGIRYMTSSIEERALQKESMILYCIGAFLVFSIVNIVAMIYDWVSTLP